MRTCYLWQQCPEKGTQNEPYPHFLGENAIGSHIMSTLHNRFNDIVRTQIDHQNIGPRYRIIFNIYQK